MARLPNDHYPTPAWVPRALQQVLPTLGRTLDPCAGDGVWRRELADLATTWHDNDLRSETPADSHRDFLSLGWERGAYDTVIGNPPFALMEAFVRRGLELAPRVILLGRLGFLAGITRADRFWPSLPGCLIYTLPRRPSFVISERGNASDSQEYGVFWWDAAHPRRTEVRWLALDR